NSVVDELRKVLRFASAQHRFPTPFANFHKLPVFRPEVRPFSAAQVSLLLARAPQNYRDYLIVRLRTGLRGGEIGPLKWEHVDLANRKIYVREAVVLDEEDQLLGGSFSERDIELDDEVVDALRRQRDITGNR